MKMAKIIWRQSVCAALILAILIGMAGSAWAETMVTLDGAVKAGTAGETLTGLRVSGLSAPVSGLPRDERAMVTSAEGMSWEIPVLWLDENGAVAEGIVWTNVLQPVLVFYLPEGYRMDSTSLALADDVAALFGDAGVLSVHDRGRGITFIFPGNIDWSKTAPVGGMAVNRAIPGASGNDSGRSDRHDDTDDDDDEEEYDWPVTPEKEPEEEPEKPAEESGDKLVDLYCSKTVRDALAPGELHKLVDLVVNRLQPQAVNLLKESFPSFTKAAESGGLGRQLGLYVYYKNGDKDGNKYHEIFASNSMAEAIKDIWRDEADENLYHFGYMFRINAEAFALLDSDGKPVVDGDGKVKLKDKTTNLENTLVHEMFHIFMNDYNRVGMTGLVSPQEEFTGSETDKTINNSMTALPSWFVEGTATSVDGNYNYRNSTFSLFRYDPKTKDMAERFSRETVLNAYVHPIFDLPVNSGAERGEYPCYFDLESSNDTIVDTDPSNYVTGYLATLYLSELAAKHTGLGSSIQTDAQTGNVTRIDSKTLRMGLDNIISRLHSGETLDSVIREVSGGRYEDTFNFKLEFIKGKMEGETPKGDDPSLDFCVTLLNYLGDMKDQEGKARIANGSILLDFDTTLASPLDPEAEAKSDLYKIIESNDIVESTVDFWKDGGKERSGTPAAPQNPQQGMLAQPDGEGTSEPLNDVVNPDQPQEMSPEAPETENGEAAPNPIPETIAEAVPQPEENDAAPETQDSNPVSESDGGNASESEGRGDYTGTDSEESQPEDTLNMEPDSYGETAEPDEA